MATAAAPSPAHATPCLLATPSPGGRSFRVLEDAATKVERRIEEFEVRTDARAAHARPTLRRMA